MEYIILGLVALAPAVLALVINVLEKKTALGKMNYIARQILYGVLFGGLAIMGTEFGIPVHGAQVNCRDAAVLVCGLCLGGPAGIIAGFIGGIERWFAVYWGIGTFTRVACSVSTIVAGLYGAGMRKLMFQEKRPGPFMALAIGMVMEIFHLNMVFLTNMNNPSAAIKVVASCTIPMVIANALSVAIGVFLINLHHGDYRKKTEKKLPDIAEIIQAGLLVAVFVLFIASSIFIYNLQSNLAKSETDKLLTLAIQEVADDIEDATNEDLLVKTRAIAEQVNDNRNYLFLNALSVNYGVKEISFVNEKGRIIRSTIDEYIDFDFHYGDQSAEFLCLLGDTTEYVQPYTTISLNSNVWRKYAGIKTAFGFIQVGYDSEQFQANVLEQLEGITKNRHVGASGYILILDNDNVIVSAPGELSYLVGVNAGADTMDIPDTTYTMKIDLSGAGGEGENYYVRYNQTEGYSIVALYPESEALQERNITLYVNTFLEVLIFAVFFLLVYMLIRHAVVYRFQHVNDSMKKITEGNLDTVVDVRTSYEFSYLSDTINETVGSLKNYIAEASARIDKELEFAKNIQKSALPNVYPAYPSRKDFDIYAFMDTAKEVGGDFYDYYMTGQDALNFLIADVSGKGIPAALFMMRAKTELKSLTESGIAFADIFTKGNEALCEGNDAGMFVTAWQGKIDLNNGNVIYSCAGHNPPIIIKKDGTAFYLKGRPGFVLAGMDGVRYKEQSCQLEEGDIIFLYTDGVTEATDLNSQLFGEDRLLETLTNQNFADMKELCHSVKQKVDEFVGEAEQFDDITMVALKYKGQPPVPTIHFEESSLNDIPAVTEFVEAEMEKRDIPMKLVINFSVAIDEIYSNIVKYGYVKAKKGPVTVKIIDSENPKRICLKFEDEGIPYNPLTKADPDVTLSAEDREIGGLGIYMVKKTMDDIKYRYEDGKNVLTIIKNLE